jgi:predicted nucleotidyltransferase component of viral defense system
LAFRGGTALYKLFLKPPLRYSEDIDLVQIDAGPAGELMDALRAVLNPWLGKPNWKQTEGRVTFIYRFDSEDSPPVPLKLKMEINTREHLSVYGIEETPFRVSSRWFEGECVVQTYRLDELLGTKLRALYQRRQGRDLFDLAAALDDGRADPARIIESFQAYMDHGGSSVSRAQFEQNLAGKLADKSFAADIGPLLAQGYDRDVEDMAATVSDGLIARLSGEPWQSGE